MMETTIYDWNIESVELSDEEGNPQDTMIVKMKSNVEDTELQGDLGMTLTLVYIKDDIFDENNCVKKNAAKHFYDLMVEQLMSLQYLLNKSFHEPIEPECDDETAEDDREATEEQEWS